jgi:acyl transferase domain-containing protein/NADPH:quinone reductase-like Zn-dependent oxidoreductase/acyl carrier protein/NADP-dependent 3-hydroxy acid dehydrogenase YdfG
MKVDPLGNQNSISITDDIEFIKNVVADTIKGHFRSLGLGRNLSDIDLYDSDLLFSVLPLDSLDLMVLAESISEKLDVDMELTSLIDYPTIGMICTHIKELLTGGTAQEGVGQPPPSKNPLRAADVCIIGENTKVPCESWEKDAIRLIPFARWDSDTSRHGLSTVRFGAFLDSIECFDTAVWSISEREGKLMDPQQRLVLESVAELTCGASRPSSGIFVGASGSDYQCLIEMKRLLSPEISPYEITSGGIGVIAGRVAYHLGMKGPALATDTACSSSLVSLAVAAGMMEQSILETCFACGINVILDRRISFRFQSANMLAPDGRCKAMDSSGDGFSRGEAVTTFELSIVHRDTNEDRTVYYSTPKNNIPFECVICTIQGIAINQDGRSSRLTAPNGPAQTALITEALKRGERRSSEVAALMLHGTGTPLGDPIEVGAACKAYTCDSKNRIAPIILNAVKTILGHSEAAAGAVSIAGATKMESSFSFLPNIHLRLLNESISKLLEKGVEDVSTHLPRESCSAISTNCPQRLIGVSSFASQGTNCHAILSYQYGESLIKEYSGRSNLLKALLWRKKATWVLPQLRIRMRLVSSNGSTVIAILPSLQADDPDGITRVFLEASESALELMAGVSAGHGLSSLVVLGGCKVPPKTSMVSSAMTLCIRREIISLEFDKQTRLSGKVAGLHKLRARAPVPARMVCVGAVGPQNLHVLNRSIIACCAVRYDTPFSLALDIWMIAKRYKGHHNHSLKSAEALTLLGCEETCCHERFFWSRFGLAHSPCRNIISPLFDISSSKEAQSETGHELRYCFTLAALSPVDNEATYPANRSDIFVDEVRFTIPYQGSILNGDARSVAMPLALMKQMVTAGPVPSACTTELSLVSTLSHSPEHGSQHPRIFDVSLNCIAESCVREDPSFRYVGRLAAENRVWPVGALVMCSPTMRHARSDESILKHPVVIHGGTGGIGSMICQCLLQNGAPILCSSRTGMFRDSGMAKRWNRQAKIVIRKSSSASKDEAHSSIDVSRADLGKFWVVHASGVLHDAGIINQQLSRVYDMFAPKCAAAELLFGKPSNLAAPMLSIFAFSSVAALIHPAGSSAYGAINASMELVVASTMKKGIDAHSIQWGAWSVVGMVSGSLVVKSAMKKLGISTIHPIEGLTTFFSIVGVQLRLSVIACVPLIEGDGLENQFTKSSHQRAPLARRSEECTILEVQGILSRVLGRPVDDVDESLIHYGADSLCAIEIQQTLSREFDVKLSSTILYDFPTVKTIASVICEKLHQHEVQPALSQSPVHHSTPDFDGLGGNNPDIYIQSMLIRSPGTRDVTADCTKVAGYDRWDVNALAREAPQARFGKFLDGCDRFDADLFRIESHEAQYIDPQHRLLLEDSFAVVSRDDPSKDEGTGVAVAMSFWDYSSESERFMSGSDSILHSKKLVGRNLSVASGRISFIHGFRGPSMTIDTACSSSLVAIHTSITTLLHSYHPPYTMLIGSSMLSLSPDVMRSLSLASMISDEGRSRTLDGSANGYGRGEAAVTLLLERADRMNDLIPQRHEFQAIFKSSTVNQDGRSASLTSPNGRSQEDLIRTGCCAARISPLDFSLHELHGTGTPLGDPIELEAFARTQMRGIRGLDMRTEQRRVASSPMLLSASKTCFGHSEPVSGCLGVYSSLMQILDSLNRPLLHLRSPSKHIEPILEECKGRSRTLLPTRAKGPFPARATLMASISAFSFQGTNANVIIERAPSDSGDRCGLSELIVHSLPEQIGYRGKRHWFARGFHPWMHPASRQPNYRRQQKLTWVVQYSSLRLHAIRQHRVFDKSIIPGMAIFRIMSDAGSQTLSDPDLSLTVAEASIALPIILDDNYLARKWELLANVNLSSGTADLSQERQGNQEGSLVASATIFAHSALICHAKEKNEALKQVTTNSKGEHGNIGRWIEIPSTSPSSYLANLSPDQVSHDIGYGSSVEQLDSSTHLAAYVETLMNMNVSIPVGCGSIKVDWRDSQTGATGLPFVSCNDHGWVTRRRSYTVQFPNCAQDFIHSLHSKPMRYIRKQGRETPHVALEAIEDPVHVPADAYGISRPSDLVPSIHTMKYSGGEDDIFRIYIASHEGIRALIPRKGGFGSSNITRRPHPLLEGQIRVASRELDTSLCRPCISSQPLVTQAHFNQPSDSGLVVSALRVVVGGTRGIGQLVALWMSQYGLLKGEDSILLCGRRRHAANLESMGHHCGSCIVTTLDCSRRADAAFLSQASRDMATPCRSVTHAAGIIQDQSFLKTRYRVWRRVFAPKYSGFRAVSSLMHLQPVQDAFATSSASIDLGTSGQAAYVGSNLAMEFLCQELIHAGAPIRFVRYGPWRGLGMLHNARQEILVGLGRVGLTLMSPLEGLRATVAFLGSSVVEGASRARIGIIDWREATMMSGNSEPSGPKTAPESEAFRAGENTSHSKETIKRTIQKYLQGEDTFQNVDSLSSMEMRSQLSEALNLQLPPTVLFDYPTVNKLVEHIQDLYVQESDDIPMRVEKICHQGVTGNNVAFHERTIYVNGLSHKIPSSGSQSIGLDKAADILINEVDIHKIVPLDRWEMDSHFGRDPRSIYTYFGAFVDHLWEFDSALYQIKPNEAQHMDPQVRCLLETTGSALFGLTREAGHFVGGTFIGCMFYDYLRSFELIDRGLDVSVVLGNGSPYLSGRVAYVFDLVGPCVGIDTACSSSLIAVHSGRSEIVSDSITHAVACGSNAIILPQTSALICQLGALSQSGRCLSLDASADGYGRGEAFVSCILSIDKAQYTIASVDSTAVNQDGRSVSLTAPNGPSQERLIASCLAGAHLLPYQVHSVSIHGTGTLLGDPIETLALSNVFSSNPKSPIMRIPVTLAANKALLGHCEGAAGTTGLINSLFCAVYRCSNGINTLVRQNPYLVLSSLAPRRENAPVATVTEPGPASSGTSSFGMSGTNAHAIVTEVAGNDNEKLKNNRKWYSKPAVYPQGGPDGKCRFVQTENAERVLLFHVAYTQTQAGMISDHRIRDNLSHNEYEGAHILLPATAQIEVASCIIEELSSHSSAVLQAVTFSQTSRFSGVDHATLVEIQPRQGIVHLRDRYGALPHGSARCTRHGAREDQEVRQDPRPAQTCIESPHPKMLFRYLMGEKASAHTVAIVQHGALACPSMDASLHLSSVAHQDGQIPVSCEAVAWNPHLMIQTCHNRKSAPMWTTNFKLQDGRGAQSAFCSLGLRSRPLSEGYADRTFSIWSAQSLEMVDDVLGRADPLIASNDALITGVHARHCLLAVQELQQQDSAPFPGGANSSLYVQRALLRVNENESGYRRSSGGPRAGKTVYPYHKTVEHTSEIFSSEAFHRPSRVLVLTSLGGIGSLLLIYSSTQSISLRACSRSTAGHQRFARLAGLEQLVSTGASVSLGTFDGSYQEDSRELLRDCTRHSIHHTAGTLSDALIQNVSHSDVRKTLSSKLGVLDSATSCQELCAVDSICSFSSIASLYGTKGQATYAMANAAMDERSREVWITGIPCYGIQWGLWAQVGIGMAASVPAITLERFASMGLLQLLPSEGLDYLEKSLSTMRRRFIPILAVSKMSERIDVIHTQKVEKYTADQAEYEFRDQRVLRDVKGAGEIVDIFEILRLVFQQVMGRDASDTVPLLQQGLDSISSVEFSQQLERILGMELPPTFVYDHPLLRDMATCIEGIRGSDAHGHSDVLPGIQPAILGVGCRPEQQIYISAHSCRYPSSGGMHLTPFDKDGADILRRGPFEALRAFASTFERDELLGFDASAFSLSRSVAVSLDPNIRWLLSLQQDVLFGPDMDGHDLTSTGIFLGWMWSHEHGERSHLELDSHVSSTAVTGMSMPFAVGYVAFVMHMCGPAVPVDTACSSSLVGAHLAKTALENHECSNATVNGVNSFLSIQTWSKIQSIGAESKDGRCKTLDAAADGYGRGEGFTCISITRESTSAHHQFVATLSGSSCSTAGVRAGLTAPNGPAQTTVVQEAMRRAGCNAIDNVALHGTGTALGDPIEIRSLFESFDPSTSFQMSSPKSSVGHTEGSAGLTNVFASMTSAIQGRRSAVHNLRILNPLLIDYLGGHILRQEAPLVVDTAKERLLAGCSSFGMSGVNSHVVLSSTLRVDPEHSRPSEHSQNPSIVQIFKDDYHYHHLLVPTSVNPVGNSRHGGDIATFNTPTTLDQGRLSWLADHRVDGISILPGTLFLLMVDVVRDSLLGMDEVSTVLCEILWTKVVSATELTALSMTVYGSGVVECHTRTRNHSISDLVFSGGISGGGMLAALQPTKTTEKGLRTQILHRGNDVVRLSSACERISGANMVSQLILNTRAVPHALSGAADVDATLHLSACALGKALFVPAGLGCYSANEPAIKDFVRSSNAITFASSSLPEILGRSSTVRACAHGRVTLSNLRGAMSRAYKANDLPQHQTTMCYSYEEEAAECDHATGNWSAVNPFNPVPGYRDAGFHLSVDPHSFPAHVSALQAIPVDAQYSLVGQYGNQSRALFDTFREETRRIAGVHTSNPLDDPACPMPESPFSTMRSIVPRDMPRDCFPPLGLAGVSSANLDGEMQTTSTATRSAVGVHVLSAALNFRDVLVAMGLYPGNVGTSSLGSDFAGVVLSDQRDDIHSIPDAHPPSSYRAGDLVFGQSRGVFQDRITVAPELIAPIPPAAVTMEEAATLATVYLTALNSIKCVQTVRNIKGKAILVHSASGGLGLALGQVGRALQFRVVGTAGSPRKRSYLRHRGIASVFESRHASFAESCIVGLRRDQDQVGAIVNTLTSAGMISASQSLLCAGGLFVEVSKRDIFSPNRFTQDRPDVGYHVLAVDMMPARVLQRDLTTIAGMLAKGDIAPIPSAIFPLSQITAAMNRFKSHLSIGKTLCSRTGFSPPGGTRRKWAVTGAAGALGTITCSALTTLGNVELFLPLRSMWRKNKKFTGETMLCGSAALVNVFLADVADRSLPTQLEATKLHGVVHSSGILRDSLISSMRSIADAKQVLASKSAPVLRHFRNFVTRSSIELMVSYSSISSILPNPGQGSYAWANASLDQVADLDTSRGVRHMVINWGPWAGGGMAANLVESSLNGMLLIQPQVGAKILVNVLSSIIGEKWWSAQILCLALSPTRRWALLGTADAKDRGSGVKNEVKTESEGKIIDHENVKREIKALVAGLMDTTISIETSSPLLQAGLDSLASIELISGINKLYGTILSPTFLFECSTIDEMSDRIVAMKTRGAATLTQQVPRPQGRLRPPLPREHHRTVAILDWVDSKPRTGVTPFSRWNVERSQSSNPPPRFGGFVESDIIESFDTRSFGISLREAAHIDPQHRVLLMQVLRARGDVTPNTAVAVGIAKLEDPWHVLLDTDRLVSDGNGLVSTSRAASASAGRISYHFNFQGACLAIDTACSSSLVALHMVFRALSDEKATVRRGYACGVNLPMSYRTSSMLSASSMLSRDGRCKTLDQSADGYGRAEGSAVVKVGSVDGRDDRDDRDVTCYRTNYNTAIGILGAAINQDGRSAGLTAPSGPAQEAVVNAATRGAGGPIMLVGMHGTGTTLGDPIEVDSLNKAMQKGIKGNPMALFASKSRLGHGETASGILGLVVNIEMSAAGRLKGMHTLRSLNQHVMRSISMRSTSSLSRTGGAREMAISRQDGPSFADPGNKTKQEVISCVSAFAFQGTNACVTVSCGSFEHSKPDCMLVNKIQDWSARIRTQAGHPLLQWCTAANDCARYTCRSSHPAMHLDDHRIFGEVVFPASGYLEVMSASTEAFLPLVDTKKMTICLTDVSYVKPALMTASDFYLEVTVHTHSGTAQVSGTIGTLSTAHCCVFSSSYPGDTQHALDSVDDGRAAVLSANQRRGSHLDVSNDSSSTELPAVIFSIGSRSACHKLLRQHVALVCFLRGARW